MLRTRALAPLLALSLGPACASEAESPTPASIAAAEGARFPMSPWRAATLEHLRLLEGRVAADRNDPDRSCDLALALLDANELDRASAAARHAEGLAGFFHQSYREGSRLNACIAYVEARVSEADGDATAAVDSYRTALRWGTTDEIVARLRALDPDAATEMLQWTKPVPMSGPFAKPEAFCATLPPFAKSEVLSCECTATELGGPVAPPFEAAMLVSAGCRDSSTPWTSDHRDLHLAVAVGGTWFVGKFDETDVDRRHDTSIDALTLARGPEHRLELHYAAAMEDRENGGFTDFAKQLVVVARVGPSGTPSMLPALVLTDRETSPTPESQMDPKISPTLLQDTAVSLGWPAADQLVITRVRGEPRAVGHFSVVFP